MKLDDTRKHTRNRDEPYQERVSVWELAEVAFEGEGSFFSSRDILTINERLTTLCT
jgi:hypothetical protein